MCIGLYSESKQRKNIQYEQKEKSEDVGLRYFDGLHGNPDNGDDVEQLVIRPKVDRRNKTKGDYDVEGFPSCQARAVAPQIKRPQQKNQKCDDRANDPHATNILIAGEKGEAVNIRLKAPSPTRDILAVTDKFTNP